MPGMYITLLGRLVHVWYQITIFGGNCNHSKAYQANLFIHNVGLF